MRSTPKPALRYRLLTPLYDPFVEWTMPMRRLRGRLDEQAAIAPGHRVLDLGCGSGTLAVRLAQAHPAAEIVGVDLDPEILEIARRKVTAAGTAVRLERASATRLPFPDASFDRVLSSFVFHHLTRAEKLAALGEARRVLAPGGELHIVDFGRPQGPGMWLLSWPPQLLDGLDTTRDNFRGELPRLVAAAGFSRVEQTRRMRTFFGTATFLAATNDGADRALWAERPAREQ